MKSWFGYQGKMPKGWTRVYSQDVLIGHLEDGEVTHLSIGNQVRECVPGEGTDILSWLEEAVSTGGVKPPRIESHATLPLVVREIEQAAWRIDYRLAYNARFGSKEEWDRFRRESENAAQAIWKRERAGLPRRMKREYALRGGDRADHRLAVRYLLERFRAGLPGLRWALEGYATVHEPEESMDRFYRRSRKFYRLQDSTLRMLKMLQSVLPHQPLNDSFMQILREGSWKVWQKEQDDRWMEETRPILEAFFHARWFTAVCAKYAELLPHAPRTMPGGWGGVLSLYNLR